MSYKIISRHLDQLIKEVDNHNKVIRHYITKKLDKRYDNQLWLNGLYCMMITLIKNITTFLQNDRNPAGVLIVTRSCFDTYINFENILQNNKAYLKSEKSKLAEEKNEINKIIKNLDKLIKNEKIGLIRLLDDHISRANELSSVKKEHLYEKDKREAINFPKHLNDFYKILSNYVHCGHAAIVNCQIKKGNNLYQASQKAHIHKEIIYLSIHCLLEIFGRIIVSYYYSCCEKQHSDLSQIISKMNICFDDCKKYINSI